MLRMETLQPIDGVPNAYEDADGEIIDFVGSGSNTITVLTKDTTEKGGADTTPFDPGEFTVTDLKEKLKEVELTDEERAALLDVENRVTAIDAIKNQA